LGMAVGMVREPPLPPRTYRIIPEIKNTGAVPFIAKVDLTVASGLDLPFHRASTILLSYRLAPKLIMFGITSDQNKSGAFLHPFFSLMGAVCV